MANIKNTKIIRIYGVTLPNIGKGRATAYGHGAIKNKGKYIAYVDYFIKDLIVCIQAKGLEDEIIKKLNYGKKIRKTHWN